MKLLLEHLRNNRDALLKYSDVISSAKHSVNLGSARESLIANFLKQNLPEFVSYHTGEVFDRDDKRSGQIDIVLHPITSPKINLHNAISIFPAESVLAALEIKSTLTSGSKSGSLQEALVSCKKLKELSIQSSHQCEESFIVDQTTVPFVLFAFKGPKISTLKNHLNKNTNPRELPDLIVVLDKGYYLVKHKNWHNAVGKMEDKYRVSDNQETVLLGIFEYILGIIEVWSANPKKHSMPIEAYTKNMPSIYNLFEPSS